MKCRCGAGEMNFRWCWGDRRQTDHAFNVYGCEDCGRILKNDVAADKGETWLALSGVEEGSVSPRLRGAVRDVLDYLEVDDLGEEDPQAKELRAAFDAEKTPK